MGNQIVGPHTIHREIVINFPKYTDTDTLLFLVSYLYM